MLPSSAGLSYFVEVARTRNLSRAAERLGLSQPSLSLAMQKLENDIGASLLIRDKKGVSLTPAGQQLLAHVQGLLQSWADIKAGARAAVHEVRGVYTIGCHVSVGLNFLGQVLPELMRAHPDLEIKLRHDLSRRIAEDIISLKADIGVVVNPVRHPDLIITPLCRDEVTLWRRAKGAIAEDVLICDPDLLQTQDLLKKLKKKNMAFSRVVTSGNLEIIADLTAQGGGVGILPARGAVRARSKLVRLGQAPIYFDEHCLIYRVENKKIRAIETLAGAIRSFYSIS